MVSFLYVGLGGALGAMLRYGASLLFAEFIDLAKFPYSTLFVNVVGCFAIGALLSSLPESGNENLKLLLVTGVLGGFTTYSAFGFEAISLFRTQGVEQAAIYVVLSLTLGLAAVVVGYSFFK